MANLKIEEHHNEYEKEIINYVNDLSDTPIYEMISTNLYCKEPLAEALAHLLVKHKILDRHEINDTFDYILKRNLSSKLEGFMSSYEEK